MKDSTEDEEATEPEKEFHKDGFAKNESEQKVAQVNPATCMIINLSPNCWAIWKIKSTIY